MKKLQTVVLGVLSLFSVVSCQNPTNEVSSKPTLLFADDFLGTKQWYVNSSVERTFAYVSDGYQISTDQARTWWWSGCPYTDQHAFLSPFIVEFSAKATIADPSTNGGFGLLFDQTDAQNLSWVTFDKDGRFMLNSLVNGVAISPSKADWTSCPSFIVGSANTIRIEHDQKGLELFVNGISVYKSTGFMLPTSKLGISLIVDNFGTSTTAAHFSSFKLYQK